MALKDIWQNRQNDVDDIDANDINSVAQAVIVLEDESKTKAEEIEIISTDLNTLKNDILGVEEELQMINEGGVE